MDRPQNEGRDTHETIPLLYVSDIRASHRFYCKGLGFKALETWEPEGQLAWCRIQRGGAGFMLQQDCAEDPPASSRGLGVIFYFICDEASVMHEEIVRRGIEASEPEVMFYGMKQTFITDPDGYKLCFESPVERSDEVPE